MSSAAENKMLLEHLQKISLEHDREQAAKAGSASSSQKAETVSDRQNATFATRKSPDFVLVSSEDPERGGGVRLDASSSLRGSPTSFARRSEALGRALRPTSSATATIRAQMTLVQDEDDVFNDAADKSDKTTDVAVASSSYGLNQSHIQQVDLKGKGIASRNAYVGGSPTKGRSYKNASPLDPQATYPSTACVFVANLPENREDWTLEAAVTKEFERFGVVFVKIRRDPNGMPFAFVQFTNDQSAKDARVTGKGAMILGRPCRTETVRANRTYIIYRRARTPITLEEANELLTPFGELETARFLDTEIQEQMRLPVTIRVQFKVFDPTQQVLRAFRLNKVYKVEAYDFKKAMQARARHPDRTFLDNYDRDRRSIFIGDLPLTFTDGDIRTLMEDVGGVVSVQIKRLDYHREGPKLIAFVEFTNPALPDMAIERYHLNEIGGSIIRVERRTDRRRRESNMPARIQSGPFSAHGASSIGGRPPSTPAREQRGPLAIEAGPSTLAHEAVRGTPSIRSESRAPMDHSVIQANAGPIHQTPQGMQQHPAAQAFNQAPSQGPMQYPMAPPPMPNQMASQMAPQMGPQMMPQMASQMPPQMGQMGTPMGPPMMPPQMGTPMMPGSGYNSYVASPYSQGAYSQSAYSQGTGSAYGFMTPQQSPAPFWGYGVGTPLWTPFPIDPAAYMAYTSPAPPPRSNVGMAPAAPVHVEANQVTQSEPIMGDTAQAPAEHRENGEH